MSVLFAKNIPVLIVYSFITGVFLSVVYDFFRILRNIFTFSEKHKKAEFVIVFFEDLIFSVFAGIVSIILVYYTYAGAFRVISLVSEAAGFCLYHFTLGKAVVSICVKLICFLKKIILKIIHTIIFPVLCLLWKMFFLIVERPVCLIYTEMRMKNDKSNLAKRIFAQVLKKEDFKNEKKNERVRENNRVFSDAVFLGDDSADVVSVQRIERRKRKNRTADQRI